MKKMKGFHPLRIWLLLTLASSLFAKEDTMLLKLGSIAPDFSLLSSDSTTVKLSDFSGKKYVVLIFYPGDQTPGCTAQLCAIRDDYSLFEAKNAKVFGVNPGDLKSHKKFIEKQRYQFPLLIDANRTVAKLYGCDSWPMVKRTVYVIGIDGKILFAKRGKPANAEILRAIP
jgi:thioredoxin-dependent peroxiredoxin